MIVDFAKIRQIQALDGFQPEVGRAVWMLGAARWRLLDCLDGLDTAVIRTEVDNIPAQCAYKSIGFQTDDTLVRYQKEI